jgi:hypothetical protein
MRCEGERKEFPVESGEKVGGSILWNGRKLSCNNKRGTKHSLSRREVGKVMQ